MLGEPKGLPACVLGTYFASLKSTKNRHGGSFMYEYSYTGSTFTLQQGYSLRGVLLEEINKSTPTEEVYHLHNLVEEYS